MNNFYPKQQFNNSCFSQNTELRNLPRFLWIIINKNIDPDIAG